MKEQIIEMLDSSTIIVNEYEDRAIPTTEFNELAEKIVKLLAAPAVSGMTCKCGNKKFIHRHSNWIECTVCNKIQILQA